MELPLRKIEFTEGDEDTFGAFAISRVLSPAIKEDAVLLSEQFKTELAVQDEEKRIVFGAVLIPDMKVYRNQNGEEYNLTVDAPTIERIAVNFFAKNRANNVNPDHENVLDKGFTFFQSIVTNELMPTVKGFEHLPMGTWFLGAKVNNEEAWQEFKDGKYKGWSIHAAFRQVPVELSEDTELKNTVTKLFSLI